MMTRGEMETRRIAAAEMIADGAKQSEIARRFGVSRTSASRWFDAVKNGRGMKLRKPPGRPRRLSANQAETLKALWTRREKWTYGAFAAEIEIATGVKFTADHVGRVVHRLGLRAVRPRRMARAEATA